jgi:hypothetical protein
LTLPTLLTTKRMSPALAARVQASVSGQPVAHGARLRPRAVSLLRFATLCMLFIAVGGFALLRQRELDTALQERTVLQGRIRRELAALAPGDLETVDRTRSWLLTSAGDYSGELIAEELRDREKFASLLARPTVYVRGDLGSFRTNDGLRQSAAASTADAFVHCLNDPPPARAEKAVLASVRRAYAGGERHRQATSHVQRLHAALLGLPLLQPAWQAKLAGAETELALGKLRRELERAPLEAARRALAARLLLFVLDEPADTTAPAELDGERAHLVRVGLVDLATQKVLLRWRKRVDPSWISDTLRAEYASGMDSCLLALDLREAASGVLAASQR